MTDLNLATLNLATCSKEEARAYLQLLRNSLMVRKGINRQRYQRRFRRHAPAPRAIVRERTEAQKARQVMGNVRFKMLGIIFRGALEFVRGMPQVKQLAVPRGQYHSPTRKGPGRRPMRPRHDVGLPTNGGRWLAARIPEGILMATLIGKPKPARARVTGRRKPLETTRRARAKVRSPHPESVRRCLDWIDRVSRALDETHGAPSHIGPQIKAFRDKLATFRDGVITAARLRASRAGVMRQLEVRCCCEPRKLLGWIQVPDHMMVLGKELTVSRPPVQAMGAKQDLPAMGKPDHVTFKVTSLQSGFGHIYLCLKADGFTTDECRNLLRSFDFVGAT